MTIKLTKQQLDALHLLLRVLLHLNRPTKIADKLLIELVEIIEQKVAKKIKQCEHDNRKGYSLKLSSIDSKALYCFLTQQKHRVEESYQFEVIVANRIVRDIDQEYA